MEDASSSKTLRVLEFYSGIGGMRYALEQAGVLATIVEAFDINNIANDVYEYNFGHRPNQGNIQHLTALQLDSYKADAWLLSPPCQPYTRQGLQKDAGDSRAFSFLKLLQRLSLMSCPPTHLFVENVVGFECSASHDQLVESLEREGFQMQEFILTPLQFGIPYSRPRYFCLAKRAPYCFLYPKFNGRLLCRRGPLGPSVFDTTMEEVDPYEDNVDHLQESSKFHVPEEDPTASCRSISDYLDTELLVEEYMISIYARYSSGNSADCISTHCHVDDINSCSAQARSKEQKLSEVKNGKFSCFKVPDSLIDRWGDAFDVVNPDSKRCCCFTKSYGRFVKGTGSFLATEKYIENGSEHSIDQFSEPVCSKDKSLLKNLGLRYFTPREIANLHSFPQNFCFPDHVSLKQRYALLGNSLSVAVVASLLRYLLSTENNEVTTFFD